MAFDFAHVQFDPDTAQEHTRRQGFTTFEDVGYDTLWRRYLPGEPHESASVCRIGVASM